jgi:hypothetical protein
MKQLNTIAEINEYNRLICAWQNKVKAELQSSARANTVKGKKTTRIRQIEGRDITEKILGSDIRATAKKNFGEFERLSFTFPRHGVFLQKGVGRGHPIGSPRVAKDWFNSIISKHMQELVDIVGNYYAEQAINATQILID